MIPLSRRGFLTGSTLFAAALSAAAVARAQDPPRQDPPKETSPKPEPSKPEPPRSDPPKDEERRKGPKTDEEIFAEQEKARQPELVDDEGREYRICPQCGFRMYRQGRTWTCSNCGFSYVE